MHALDSLLLRTGALNQEITLADNVVCSAHSLVLQVTTARYQHFVLNYLFLVPCRVVSLRKTLEWEGR